MAKAEGSIETRIGFLRSSYKTLSPILCQRSWNGWPTTRGTMVFPQRFFFYWQRTPHHGGTTAGLSSKLSRVLCGHVSFQNLSPPCWLLANIATSRLQCRKPSLLKVVNKPALQIPRGATRRCGLSEGGWESGRRAGWSLRVVRPKLCFHNLVSLSRGQPLLTPPLSSLTRLPSLYISHFTPCFCAKCYGTHWGISSPG